MLQFAPFWPVKYTIASVLLDFLKMCKKKKFILPETVQRQKSTVHFCGLQITFSCYEEERGMCTLKVQ